MIYSRSTLYYVTSRERVFGDRRIKVLRAQALRLVILAQAVVNRLRTGCHVTAAPAAHAQDTSNKTQATPQTYATLCYGAFVRTILRDDVVRMGTE